MAHPRPWTLAPLLAAFAAPAWAADGVVGTGSPGSCTEAAFDAVFFDVQNDGGGTITFDCGAAPHVIVLTYRKEVAADTEIEGGDLITLSGGNATSIFQVYASASLTVRQLTLTLSYGPAGAIENFGTLASYDSHFVDNESTTSGGAILSHGTAAVYGGTVENNTAAASGGGIAVAAGDMLIDGTTFMGNQATDVFAQGGAVVAESDLTLMDATFVQNHSSRGGGLSVLAGNTWVTQSHFDGNWAAYGGGIRQEGGTLTLTDVELAGNGYGPTGTKITTGGGAMSWGDGTATLTNVTMAGNWASYGGGFDHANGTTTLVNVTVSGNEAVGGGGFDQGAGTISLTNVTLVDNEASFFAGGMANRGGTLTVRNVAVTNSAASKACNQALAAGNVFFSLASDFTCGMGIGRNGVAMAFAPLADNGGFTRTHLQLAGNPVVDNGTGTGCPSTDQRGVTRPVGAACDVGAVEYTPPTTTTTTSSSTSSSTSTSSSSSTSVSTTSTSSSSSTTSSSTTTSSTTTSFISTTSSSATTSTTSSSSSTSVSSTSTSSSTATTSSSTTTSSTTTSFVSTTSSSATTSTTSSSSSTSVSSTSTSSSTATTSSSTDTSTTLASTTVTSTTVESTTTTTSTSSTTTLPPPCTAEADGFARADCQLARLVEPGSCAADTPDVRLREAIPKKVDALRGLLERAAEAGSPKALGKLLHRTDRKLGRLGRRIERSKKTPAECQTALGAIVSAARDAVGGLGAS